MNFPNIDIRLIYQHFSAMKLSQVLILKKKKTRYFKQGKTCWWNDCHVLSHSSSLSLPYRNEVELRYSQKLLCISWHVDSYARVHSPPTNTQSVIQSIHDCTGYWYSCKNETRQNESISSELFSISRNRRADEGAFYVFATINLTQKWLKVTNDDSRSPSRILAFFPFILQRESLTNKQLNELLRENHCNSLTIMVRCLRQ